MSKCRFCGHSKSEHGVVSGPNSIGAYFRSMECTHDASHYGYEILVTCKCLGYKKLRWWNKRKENTNV